MPWLPWLIMRIRGRGRVWVGVTLGRRGETKAPLTLSLTLSLTAPSVTLLTSGLEPGQVTHGKERGGIEKDPSQ